MPDPESPRAQLVQMAMAHWVSRLVFTAAQLNLADHLADGPRTAAELGQLTSTDAPSLYRVMRTLASLGLFTEDSTHRFSLTPLGEALKTGTAGSVRASILTLAGDPFTKAQEQLTYSIRTGKSGFEKAYALPYHSRLDRNTVPDHSWQLSPGDETRGTIADYRDGSRGGGCTTPGKDARHHHAYNSRRSRAE